MTQTAFLAACRDAIGAAHVLTDPHDTAPYLTDWRRRYTGAACVVLVRPRPLKSPRSCGSPPSTRRARAARRQHGPRRRRRARRERRQVVLSPQAAQRVRGVDPHNQTITVEAGFVLQRCRRAPKRPACLFPLSLAAEGSCTIGGNLATNAGGTQVLRYGNARELCLGLEVVTAAGRDLGRPARPAQGQHRLRPARPVHRQRRHAGHHHRGHAEAVSAAGRGAHRAGDACRRSQAARRLARARAARSAPALTGFEVMNATSRCALVRRHFRAAAPAARRPRRGPCCSSCPTARARHTRAAVLEALLATRSSAG